MKITHVLASKLGKYLKILVPEDLVLPIKIGKLKGKKWIVSSSNLECALGTYEYKKRVLFENEVSKNDIVYDIGAHVGFYTLLASELVGVNGFVVAFEPFPQNFSHLKNHVEINNCTNVMINEAAVSNSVGVSMFKEGTGTYTGRLTHNGEIPVKTFSLDEFVRKHPHLMPNCLKIDVEGAEFSVLKGASNLIKKSKPKIFLATHNELVHKKCVDFLKKNKYFIECIGNQSDELFACKN